MRMYFWINDYILGLLFDKNALKLGIRPPRGINSTTGIGFKIELDQIENELELELQYWNVKRSLKSIPEPDPGVEL